MDAVDDKGVHSLFHELLRELGAKVPAKTGLFCRIQGGFLVRVDLGGV